MAIPLRKAAFLIEISVLVTFLLGCQAAPATAQTQAADVAPEPRAEYVEGDVHQPTITEMEESARESGVETGGGHVSGDVSTVRYGLDDGMAGLLKQYGERTVGVLGKVIGSAIVAVAGLLLWALNTNATSSETLKLVGQVVGLAAMIGGPIMVWAFL
jgi:lysozyme family protein